MKSIIKAKQIFTLSNNHPVCKIMVVEDGQILEILDQMPEKIDPDYELVSLEDYYIYPAFNDTHMHLVGYGAYLNQCQLDKSNSIANLKCLLSDYASSTDVPIIIGRGWNHDYFDEGRLPTRYDLDEACSDRPVILHRVCGHIAVVNSKALEMYSITEDTLIEGGGIDLNNGLPTGILRENALSLVQGTLTKEDIRNYIKSAQLKLNAYGITSVQTDDLIMVPMSRHGEILEIFSDMAIHGELSVRVYQQSQFFTVENFEKHLSNGYQQNSGNLFFKNGPLKILADGSLGARTAKLRKPYQDDSNAKGILIHSERELIALIDCAFKHNVDVAVHGIGDYTIEFLITQLTELQKKYPNRKGRNAIIHCQIMDKSMIDAMSKSNINALVQPVFLEYDMTIVENRVGRALASTSYAYKSMQQAGIVLGFGSDAPVEDPNPLRSIYYAITRQRPDGQSFFKEECLTLNEALKAFTTDAAIFSYEEHIKGKLDKGYLADFVCFSKPLDSMNSQELLEARVEATYIGGKCVYTLSHPKA